VTAGEVAVVDGVAPVVADLASRLVPGCDPAVVGAVLAAATAGCGGARLRDGRRASVLTRSGMPFEASVTGGDGRPAAALRYVVEPASSLPFFGPRLAAQRAVVEQLAGWLPAGAGPELADFVATAIPDPPAVPARTRFALFIGVVHEDDAPAEPAWLKVYANVAGDRGALDRLAARWSGFGRLPAALPGGVDLVPRFAAIELAASGERRAKLYLRPPAGRPVALGALLPAGLPPELAGWAGDETVGSRSFVCAAAADGADPPLSVYLPARDLGLDPAGLAALVAGLARRCHGGTAAVDALTAAAVPWEVTALGVSGGGRKLNVYAAPSPYA
jgi:hypothetical protein